MRSKSGVRETRSQARKGMLGEGMQEEGKQGEGEQGEGKLAGTDECYV